MSLMLFLDFMETIGLFHKKGYVTLEDLDELCGSSIRFFYEIFIDYINHARQQNGDNKFCRDFETLARML